MTTYQPIIQVFTCGPDLVPTGYVRLSFVELALVNVGCFSKDIISKDRVSNDIGDTGIT